MNFKYLFLFLTLTLFLACAEKGSNIVIDFEADQKMTLSGALIANSSITMAVGKSLTSFGNNTKVDELVLKNANVYITEDRVNTFIATYNPDTRLYESSNKVKPGSEYVLKVEHVDFADIATDTIKIPNNFTITTSKVELVSDSSTVCGFPGFAREYYVYFNFNINEASVKDLRFNFIWNSKSNLLCGSLIHKNAENCVDGNLFQLDCKAPNEPFILAVYRENDLVGANTSLKYEVRSSQYTKYASSVYENLGNEIGLVNKARTYSNIKNGYGLVYGINSANLTFFTK